LFIIADDGALFPVGRVGLIEIMFLLIPTQEYGGNTRKNGLITLDD